MQGHREEEATSARERLLSAAMELLIERGYRGATSREIARRAGVNEVTLFRLFSTKDELIATALVKRAGSGGRPLPPHTGNLVHDLEALVELTMQAFADDEAVTVRLLPEIKRMPEPQQEIVRAGLSQTHRAMMAIIEPYQRSGELDPELGDAIWPSFVGPLLMRALGAQIGLVGEAFDTRAYVRSFLRGAGGPAYRAREQASG